MPLYLLHARVPPSVIPSAMEDFESVCGSFSFDGMTRGGHSIGFQPLASL